MNKFRKGDEVIIIAGADKNKTGKILAVKGDKVLVENVNLKTIHKKPTSQEAGKIVKEARPVHISNISHVENGKPVKVKIKIAEGEGKSFKRKERVSKKSENKI